MATHEESHPARGGNVLDSLRESLVTAKRPPSLPRSRLWWAVAVGIVALLVWAYWSTLTELVGIWDSSPDYSHGYLVVPIAAWFLWLRRKTLPWSEVIPSWGGLSLLLLAAGCRLVAARFYFPELDGFSLPLWLAGACWLFGGFALMRWASPALAFLLFMVPLPASVETLLNQPLQALATNMSTWTLQSLGQPAISEGMTILLDEHRLEVERACSGLRMFYGILALAFVYIIATRARLAMAVVLLLAVAPVAILANVMRITATGLLYEYASSEAARRFSHDLAGIAMIVLAVALFALVLFAIQRTLMQLRTTRSRALMRMAMTLLGVAAIVPAGYFWHESIQKRTVDRFLRRADQLEESGEYAREIDYLDRFLRVQPQRADIQERIARIGDRIAITPLRKLRVMELYHSAWNVNPTKVELGIREGELAIDLARFDDALDAAKRLVTVQGANGSQTQKARAEGARIHALALLGRAVGPDVVVPEAEWKQIVAAFQEAIRQNPREIELSARLAEIYRHRLKQPAEPLRQKLADQTIDAMVKANSDRPEAWLARYLYRKSLHSPSEKGSDADSDLDRAVELGRSTPAKESADVLLYAGQRASDRKDSKTAREFFERATRVRPADFRGWLRLGELTAANKTEAGRKEAVRIWTEGLDKVGRYEIDLVLPLAAMLIELRQFADAEEKLRPLDAALHRLVEPGRSLVELGTTRLRAGAAKAQGNTISAASLLRGVLNSTRESSASTVYRTPFADAWLQLGDYYSDLRFDDQAVEAYESAGRLDPDLPDWRLKAARAAERNGRPADAAQHYREAATKNPDDPAVWLALARASFLDQIQLAPPDRNWQEFTRSFDKAVQRKANPVVLYMLEADYSAANGKLDEAAAILSKGVARVPQAWELWQAFGIIQERRKASAEVATAIAGLRKTATNPEMVPLFESRLDIEAGRFDHALTVITSALSTSTGRGKTLLENQLVELELRRGNRGAARHILEESSRREPDNLQLLDNLAQLLVEERDWKSLEKLEGRLKSLEGPDGTLWRDFRARRLLMQTTELDDPRFREADRLTREIAALRPGWQRRYVLQGALARRQNQLDEAITDYQQAIRLGNRSIALSEELIDLLMEQRRFGEADHEFQRVRQAVARSSRLTSVAIPIYVRRGETDEALRLAEDWVRRQPSDASSYVRLGRTVLLTATEGTPDYSKAVIRAQEAFEKAVALSPTDVRVWVELFRFYTGVQKNDEAAGSMLKRLAARIDIPQPQKVFVLAQLYESIGSRGEASRFYVEAIKSAPADAQLDVLQRAAHFFVVDDPAQAESYCRTILQRRPKSVEVRRTLVRALAEQGGEQRLREAATILKDVGRIGGSNVRDHRLEAILLARTGRSEDRQRSIELLESLVQIPQQTLPSDRVLLATLYESEHRLMPAYEQLRAAARREDSTPVDLVRYVEFLYRNSGDQPQFADYAEPVLAHLENDRQNRTSAVHLRLVAAKKVTNAARRQALIRQVVDDSVRRFVTQEPDVGLRRETLAKLLILLTHDDLADEALLLVRRKGSTSESVDTAIALADALTLLPPDSKLAIQTKDLIAAAVKQNPQSADLLYSVANYRYVTRAVDEAIILFRKVLVLNPKHKLAMNNLAVALADRPATAPEALELIERAIKQFGAQAALLDTKGQVLVALGRANDGLAAFSEALSSQGGDALLLLHQANAYLAAGRPAEARLAYRRSRSLNVASAVVTPGDRTILERLEVLARQTAAAGG